MQSRGRSHKSLHENVTGLMYLVLLLFYRWGKCGPADTDFHTNLPYRRAKPGGRTQVPDFPLTTGIVGKKPVCIFLSLTLTLETWEPFLVDSHIVFFLLVWNIHLPSHWSGWYFMSSCFPFNLLQSHPTLSFHLHSFQIGLMQISISSSSTYPFLKIEKEF